MHMNIRIVLSLTAVALFCSVKTTQAMPIEFVFEGEASGFIITKELDSEGDPIEVEFVDQDFIITAYGDTNDWTFDAGLFSIFNDSAEILFPNLNGGTQLIINDLTTLNVNTPNGVVTFGNDDKKQDTIVIFDVPAIQSWDRMSSVGPVSVADGYVDTPFGHETSGGELYLDYNDPANVSFRATVIPEPASLVLLGLGGIAALLRHQSERIG